MKFLQFLHFFNLTIDRSWVYSSEDYATDRYRSFFIQLYFESRPFLSRHICLLLNSLFHGDISSGKYFDGKASTFDYLNSLFYGNCHNFLRFPQEILIKSWKIISSFPLSSDDFAVKLLHGHRNRINDFNKCKWCLRSREDPQEMKIIVTLIKNIASSLSESAEDCARRQMSLEWLCRLISHSLSVLNDSKCAVVHSSSISQQPFIDHEWCRKINEKQVREREKS